MWGTEKISPKKELAVLQPSVAVAALDFFFAQPLRAAPLRRPTPEHTESSYVRKNKLP